MLRKVLIILLLLPAVAWAAPKDDLAKTQAAIKAAEVEKAKLAKEQEKLEAELKNLQEKLVRSASQVQQSEAQLSDAEGTLTGLTREMERKEKALAGKREKMDGLARMAIRLSRTPPQAMVLMPEGGKERIQAARALSLLTDEIKHEAGIINEDLQAMNRLQSRVAGSRSKAEKIRHASRQEKKAFEKDVAARRSVLDKLASERAAQEKKIASLARKASNLENLITSLDKEAERGKEVESAADVVGKRGKLRDFARAKGDLRVPVSGRVVVNYGAKDGSNDTSKGVKIAAREGATVIAPYDGEVAYSGVFLNYGKLVILKHRGGKGDNFHTLLAGLARVDVKTGEFLLEGEPIGAMGDGETARLYVELRKNNQPFNPVGWMKGI